MKNIKYYDKDTFDFFLKVLSRKHTSQFDSDYKNRIQSLSSEIKKRFNKYDSEFNSKNLESISSCLYEGQNKEDLQKLYFYQSKIIQDLKTTITTTETNRILSTCQNCTISEINSFDHLLPKDIYAEFSVNPKNLFPSCTKCNSYKSKNWLKNNKRCFLNLYLDELPKAQYLFVNLVVTDEIIEIKFYLNNKNNIDKDLFSILHNHYYYLHLYERFKENSDSVVIELINSIKPYLKSLSIDVIKRNILDKVARDKEVFGYNYWKSILETSLINNNNFVYNIIGSS